MKKLIRTDYLINLRFTYRGIDFIQTGIDLKTNMVSVKNVATGKFKEVDYNRLKQLLEE